jgi:ABC-type polar amino acid transport system ATPase subunit
MMVVTHEMSFARRVADRMIFMKAGRIVEKDPSVPFSIRPRTERAEAFLGAIGAA